MNLFTPSSQNIHICHFLLREHLGLVLYIMVAQAIPILYLGLTPGDAQGAM